MGDRLPKKAACPWRLPVHRDRLPQEAICTQRLLIHQGHLPLWVKLGRPRVLWDRLVSWKMWAKLPARALGGVSLLRPGPPHLLAKSVQT